MAKTYEEYNLSEEEMQSLIDSAKGGIGRAQNELLTIFDNFLSKYVDLLYYGKYNMGNYDTRRFIALFVKDPSIRYYLLRNKLTAAGHKQVGEVIQPIRVMAERYGDEEDVRQTVNMTFFQCVARYEVKESERGPIPFSSYLYSYYFYLLKKNVDAFLIDQLGRKTFPLITEEDFGDGDDEKLQGFQGPSEPSAEELLGTEEIDEFWVVGDTAMPPFNILTIQERQLLKWRYVDGHRSSEIAARITEHPNTVREHFNKIRQRIKDSLSEELDY